MPADTPYAVVKNDERGHEVLRYDGTLIRHDEDSVQVRALWSGPTARDLGYVVFEPGDVFIEWHYSDRWYNIFQVHNHDETQLKGWYCNFVRPAVITPDYVAADDLALDCFVYPDGRQLVLDQDDYDALDLTDSERKAIAQARTELEQRIAGRTSPFDRIRPA